MIQRDITKTNWIITYLHIYNIKTFRRGRFNACHFFVIPCAYVVLQMTFISNYLIDFNDFSLIVNRVINLHLMMDGKNFMNFGPEIKYSSSLEIKYSCV